MTSSSSTLARSQDTGSAASFRAVSDAALPIVHFSEFPRLLKQKMKAATDSSADVDWTGSRGNVHLHRGSLSGSTYKDESLPTSSTRHLPRLPTEAILPYVMDRSVSFTLGRSRHRRPSAPIPAPDPLLRAFSVQKIHLRPLPQTPPPPPTLGKSMSRSSSAAVSSSCVSVASGHAPFPAESVTDAKEGKRPLPVTPHSCRRVLMKAVKNCRNKQRLSKSEDCLETSSSVKSRGKGTSNGRFTAESQGNLSEDQLSTSYSTWCVVRRGEKNKFGAQVRLRPRSMDVALLLKRKSGSPMLLPSNTRLGRSVQDLDKRGKFYVMRRNVSLEAIGPGHGNEVG